jgi:hypothetical protein
MNDKKKFDEDPLRKYITPQGIEKAPEGFTSKIMSHIHVDTKTAQVIEKHHKTSPVPMISAFITVILIISAILIPGSESDSSEFMLFRFISNIEISLPSLDLTSAFAYKIPDWIIYSVTTILILAIFDKLLSGFLRREKNNKS